jgi:hypothetical protein
MRLFWKVKQKKICFEIILAFKRARQEKCGLF